MNPWEKNNWYDFDSGDKPSSSPMPRRGDADNRSDDQKSHGSCLTCQAATVTHIKDFLSDLLSRQDNLTQAEKSAPTVQALIGLASKWGVNPWEVDRGMLEKLSSLVLKNKNPTPNKLQTEAISKMLKYYVETFQTQFDTINSDTKKYSIEYAFNINVDATSLNANNFLESIIQSSLEASDIYTSNDGSHVTPVYNASENQLFSCFIHSHPNKDGMNLCFSHEDILSLIRMAITVHYGNRFKDREHLGKYFTFIVGCPTCRYALVVTDVDKLRSAYNEALVIAKEKYSGTNTQQLSNLLLQWYSIDDASPINDYKLGNNQEKKTEEAVKYVLQKLGEDCGISFFKSDNTDSHTFNQLK